MTQTMTALFDTRADAMTAVDQLTKAGLPRTAIRVMPDTDAPATTTATTYDTSRDDKGFWASLGDLFMPDEDRHTYTEAMHRGSIMVSVTCEDAMASKAEDILEQHGTVNIDERETTWRKEGWAGYQAPAVPATGATTSLAATGTAGQSAGLAGTSKTGDLGAERLEEVEERLKVGKRQVSAGRVKVRSYVIETPVKEDVNLRSETVHVERRPVDRVLGAGENAFRDRTIEATATSEEAVVSKEARVTGEVLLKKDVGQRTETVTDKVRSTKVEVEDDRTGTVRTSEKLSS